ncbi:uncharacterized protein [Palaemon carinicauda]|uniref:uncharacterized protein n=1 Tax=Palaemon carinicauda TaxID=392227 RepID=UPI0035B61906
MASKITMDMIKPFTGEGDVVSWLKKVTLVAKLQKIVDLASFIPLYLEGDALALYLEMGDEDQECAAKSQEKLKVAVSDDPFSAFGKLVQLKWTGEPVDVYTNEIRRLAGLAKFDKVGLENVVKLTFVNGFPDNLSVALQRLPNVMTMAMSELISHARILSSKQQGGVGAVTVRKGGEGGGAKHENRARPFQFRGQCFRCGGPLMIKDCKETQGLVDTGCSTSVLHSKFVPRCKGEVYTSAFDGSHIKCKVADCVELGVNGKCVTVRTVVSNQLVNGVDVVLGVDVIDQLGGVTVTQGKVDVGIIPLMAVEQPTKNKVRPVLDFWELNVNVKCHTGDDVTDVCSETLRKWRQTGENVSVVDLKSAYLQLSVDEKLWPYQLVNYKGQTFCLTRLGFGLNSPQIMSRILKTVLSKDEKIERATSSYIDDILVNESIASADEVIRHLNTFGLITKSPESLNGGAALGLQLQRVGGELMFERGNTVPEVADMLTRRELFSVCGTLVGHYPIAGWLRIACSYIKRRASGARWEDPVGEQSMMMVKEVIERVKLDDPVRGNWCVPSVKHGVVWCDASKIAMGVVLEINGKIAEDAAWLRKKDDFNHINVAELEAALKGVNLAIR